MCRGCRISSCLSGGFRVVVGWFRFFRFSYLRLLTLRLTSTAIGSVSVVVAGA